MERGRQRFTGTAKLGWGGAFLLAAAAAAGAQTCTTQSRMVSNVREDLRATSLELATAIKADDPGGVGKLSVPEITNNFAATGFLIRTISEAIAGDSLEVTQLYQLDANAHVAGQSAPADFACQLAGGPSEVDFSIEGLPPGLYGFTMVEAHGPRPFLLAFLLRQDAGRWKMAGFYPRARTAGGHDGLWFWNDARVRLKAGQPWSAWLEFGLADTLLRPANFMTTTHLDKLRSERAASAPPALRDGMSADTPLVVKGVGEASFAFTSLAAEGSEDGRQVNLVMHFRADPLTDSGAARTRNLAAARALLTAHPELRQGIDNLEILADTGGQAPFATEVRPADVQ